ncbi:MAG TPA: hypothetical protein VFE33_23245 [Thermoanaerobaculia bacterium]|nr:hypothetical protein [Thermoanaerobaculia bacterium]
MPAVRRFEASVTYRDGEGKEQEEMFPVHARDYAAANELAFQYVLNVLKLDEFELRLVGA